MLALLLVTLLFTFFGTGLFLVGIVDSSVFKILLFSFSYLWMMFAWVYYFARTIHKVTAQENEEVIDEVAASMEKEKVPISYSLLGATLLLFGVTIFGGWLLASFTGNTTYLKPEDYMEWRISVTAMFILYLLILYMYTKIKKKH
ncbi:hypothetical protein [Alkalihalobacillus pseudalcaliphilus]|uniref:hypothetical protein n=1 Tax=Alkalihalobacillus pseudalcaliphilus TaxID=79884 RepID=UPI00064DEF8B|nr:hypothetical protein [Alkalihalobacillus pseudalcaliphilus]KMK74385.1 hypothetical protein AB990_20955 [Alkalihalobacillus pseudalcaliphilus]